jgi:hypothetical protein
VDWLERPKAAGKFPWDLALIGHKSCDEDPLSGPVPLAVDAMQWPHGTEAIFPLRDWTDQDVTEYTLEHGVPWDMARYDLTLEEGRSVLRTKQDKSDNSDYFHACFECCTGERDFVACPKRGGLTINSIAARVPWVEPQHPYCHLRSPHAI